MIIIADTASEVGAERLVVQRTIAAPADVIFALLSDPSRHPETEPGDWVREAIEPQPITAVGDVFAMAMFHEGRGGEYVMHNTVSELVPDRTIAWQPGQLDAQGDTQIPGWFWRYDLAPIDDDQTMVTLTYDWSATPAFIVAEVGGFPPFPPEFLDASLAALDQAVAAG